jgi:hypothetical protein
MRQRPAAAPGQPSGDWLVSPAFDLLFLANLGWLLALIPGYVAAEGIVHVEFWQVYFLTTPHRWLTLLLVAADPDRRAGRRLIFPALAALALVAVAAVYLSTGAFACLLLVDYVWNGWHFAAQHAGVLRVYSLKSGGGRPWLEKHGLRLFIFYVTLRTAGWTTGWLEGDPATHAWLRLADRLALTVPAALVALELIGRPWLRPGRATYLASVCGLYSLLLVGLSSGLPSLVLSLAVAAALFHAVEYLALVTHYAWRRQTVGSDGLFRAVARHWLAALAAFLLLLGTFAAVVQRQGVAWWVGLNLWAAFLHYAYDGLIWKLRQPATAQALGAGEPGASAPGESSLRGLTPPARPEVAAAP